MPRKTAVFIKDTATFCVELDNDCQNVRWLKNKEEVKPSDRISITCSGKQHTMTIRECKVEDAGEIAFLADESRTSTQFTYVRSPKKPPTQPPSDPVVKNKTETSVTLAWSPPRMERPIPVDGYIVERKKLTGFTWVRCHESHVPSPELTVSNLPEEADYQFRVSAVNAYGQSPYLEFPGSLHLEPVLAVKNPLTTAEVAPGGDALFTVDLTKTCSGTWYLNGKVLQESETYIINRTQTTHTLVIKNVTRKDDGTEVKFVANDKIQFLSPRQSPSESLELVCEVSAAGGAVVWRKDQTEVKQDQRTTIVCQGTQRKLIIKKVTQQDQGSYTCETKGDRTTFQVKVRDAFVHKEKVQKNVKAALSENATLSCEVAQEKTEVKWYKDGKLISSSKKFKVESEGKSRRLVVGEVEKKDAGEYTCEAAGQKLTFRINVPDSSQLCFPTGKVQKEVKAAVSENATLSCEVAQEKTEVKWYKDGKLISSSKKFKVESEGKSRRLVVGEVEKKDAGEYTCEAAGQKLTFKIDVTGVGILDAENFKLSVLKGTDPQESTAFDLRLWRRLPKLINTTEIMGV
uniref:Obscurin n=1 Tax=Junco hyemalis TaxID=40217 RepID=A0A8C5NQR2_JUNHY